MSISTIHDKVITASRSDTGKTLQLYALIGTLGVGILSIVQSRVESKNRRVEAQEQFDRQMVLMQEQKRLESLVTSNSLSLVRTKDTLTYLGGTDVVERAVAHVEVANAAAGKRPDYRPTTQSAIP
jgi:uncharacterized protein HemX